MFDHTCSPRAACTASALAPHKSCHQALVRSWRRWRISYSWRALHSWPPKALLYVSNNKQYSSGKIVFVSDASLLPFMDWVRRMQRATSYFHHFHHQILPFLPVLWHTGGQGPEHPAVAPSVHDSTVDQCLQPGSQHQVVSPLPSLCMMPSCATAVEYRAVSKSPLSSLFASDSRFQLCGDLGSIRPSAGAWVKPCDIPRRAPRRQFWTKKCSSWFGSQWIIYFKYLKFSNSVKYVAENLQSCFGIGQVWKFWNF